MVENQELGLNEITLDVPVSLGGARPVELPATKYRQGNRTQYHLAVSVAALTRLIVNRPDPNRPVEGNRKVDGKRAEKFGDYLLKRNEWVSPSITVRIPQGEVDFKKLHSFDDGTSWGVLAIPLEMLTEIILLDGQHRTLGVFLAIDKINKELQKQRIAA